MIARIFQGDCRAIMRRLIRPETVDAVVTDPPYELGFMGKGWDRTGVAFDPETWAECLRLMKPGAHLAAFGGTRTAHRIACAIEDAGFEIRDSLVWLYGSGMPKGKGQLKPAHEPIILARKPFAGSVAANVERHGVGALNIDAGRIETADNTRRTSNAGTNGDGWGFGKNAHVNGGHDGGRWPANVAHDGSDEVEAAFEAFGDRKTHGNAAGVHRAGMGYHGGSGGQPRQSLDASTGSASRFFYCAKASNAERVRRCAGCGLRFMGSIGCSCLDDAGEKAATEAHPTVKPRALMRWLTRLVVPPGGVVLDPFAGTGTTIEAALLEGMRPIGVEQEAEYVADIHHRISSMRASS